MDRMAKSKVTALTDCVTEGVVRKAIQLAKPPSFCL